MLVLKSQNKTTTTHKKLVIWVHQTLVMIKHILILTSIGSFAFGQNVFTNTADKAKIELAKQKMYGGKYVEAANSFEEIAKTSPNDANVYYYMGNCNFMLNKMDKEIGRASC